MANQVLYGFMNLKDVFARKISAVGVEVVTRAVTATVQEHNRQMDALLNMFVAPTTDYSKRFTTPTIARLQPLDESGRARNIKPAGYYDIAFPIQMAGGAWGANYVARAKMTVEHANDATFTLISADYRWIRDHVLAAIYGNVNWTFTDDEHGALVIKPPANGDTDKYLIQTGADAGLIDTHQLAQGAGIADATNPYPTIATELNEHPENGGEIISLIPSNLRATTEALTNFHEPQDPNIAASATAARLVGSLGANVPGQVIGYVDKNWIVEWKSMPDNYIVSLMTGGERPLGMRQDAETELRGFQRIASRADHPFSEDQFLRRCGFGAFNRVGVVVTRIGNGAYAIPTNYTSPMP